MSIFLHINCVLWCVVHMSVLCLSVCGVVSMCMKITLTVIGYMETAINTEGY